VLALAGCSDPLSDENAPRGPAGSVSARVTRHTDGDTLWLSGIGKVRLIGVDTPEVFGEDECFGQRASAFVERTAPVGAPVRYRLGVEERDRYGRALVYLWLRGGRRPRSSRLGRRRTMTFLNRLLVARGYAQVLTIPPNVEYADQFARVARRARRAGRGLWGRPGCADLRR
jgi:micrococcal nuclease